MQPKILMLTPYLPYPPVSGGRMRSYNLIKQLSQTHHITLICFGRPEERAFDLDPMRQYCELIVIDRPPSPSVKQAALLSLTTLKPITMRLYQTPAMRQKIVELLIAEKFDVIHVESFYMLQNLPANVSVPVLLSEPAIEYIAWWRHAKSSNSWLQRPGIALEALKMRFFEPRIWRQADMLGAMSSIDAAIIQKAAPQVKTMLAPNGVDTDYFQPVPTISRQAANAIFMGDYKYFPNADAIDYFIDEIMPLIRQKRPDFTLTILGKDPHPKWQTLSQDPTSGLIVTGMVDDTRPYLTQATLFACPLRSGSGTRFKLMEALACGLPVVSTSIGCEGLNAQHNHHMLIADTPQDFADAVCRLIEHPATGQELAANGRAWVVENHAWQHSVSLLAAAYQALIQR